MAIPIPIIDLALGLGGKIADIIKARVPDVNLQKQIEAETSKAVMSMDWTAIEKEFQDRADARGLAAKDMAAGNAFTSILAATVRPVWGYASLVVVAYPYLAGAFDLPAVQIDDNTRTIVQTVIAFYFGGRTVEKVIALRASK